MSQEQAILDIAKALDNIHQVLIHLTNAIQAGAPVTSSSLDADPLPGVTRAQAHAAFNPAPDPAPDPAQVSISFPDDAAPDPDPPVSNNTAPDPQPSSNGNGDLVFQDFVIDTIAHSIDDNGKPAYKGRGFPFSQYGVRIWPEIFVRLGIPIESIVIGENNIDPLYVRAVLNDMGNPRKIVGFAPGEAPAENNDNPVAPPMDAPGNDAPPFPEPYPQRKIRGTNYNEDEIPF